MFFLHSKIDEGLTLVAMFIGAYGDFWYSFVVILYYGYVISWNLLMCEICCNVLQGLGLVIFINCFVSFKHSSGVMMDYIIHPFLIVFSHIVTIIIGYVGMQCSWWFMLDCDITERLQFSMVVLLNVICCNYTYIKNNKDIII